MSNSRSKKGILIAAFVWLLLIGIGAAVYRYVVAPILRGTLISETGIDTSGATVNDKPLDANEWNNLVVAKDVTIDPITFGRGKFELTAQSQRTLDEIVTAMQSHANYYLVLIGYARSDGDLDLANQLVQERVKAAADYLSKAGIVRSRIIEAPSRPSGSSGEAQTVNFVIGKKPR